MTTSEAQPTLTALVRSLIDKTKAGRLHWQETVEVGTYIVSVGGKNTLKVTMDRASDQSGADVAEVILTPTLYVLDEHGEKIWRVESSEVSDVQELYEMAGRKAEKVDERLSRVANLIETVKKL